jgi:hypothetical protein
MEIPMETPRGARSVRARPVLRAGIAVLAGGIAATAFAAAAAADATDDYPIITTSTGSSSRPAPPSRSSLRCATSCRSITSDIIDKHNKPPEVQQAAIDSAHYFYSLSPQDRRAYKEQMATNFADPMTLALPNWAKVFFNNKGVAAKETDNCAQYPPDDQSVWDG